MPIWVRQNTRHNRLLPRSISVGTLIHSLDGINPGEAADHALSVNLPESALAIQQRFHLDTQAISTLVTHLGDAKRALAYAEQVNKPAVWFALGQTLLGIDELKGALAALSHVPAQCDKRLINDILKRAREATGVHAALLHFLQKLSGGQGDELIAEQAYCMAHLGDAEALDTLLASCTPTSALQSVSETLYDERDSNAALLPMARTIAAHCQSWPTLTLILVAMEDWPAAVQAARKANSRTIWHALFEHLMHANSQKGNVGSDFGLAQQCAVMLVVNYPQEELGPVLHLYEENTNAAVSMLEEATAKASSASVSKFLVPALAIQYARARDSRKVLPFIEKHARAFLNNAPVIEALQSNNLLRELMALYTATDQWDAVIQTGLQLPPSEWDHEQMVKALVKCSSTDILYDVVTWYEEQGLPVNDLLMVLAQRLDPTRLVRLFIDSSGRGEYEAVKGAIDRLLPIRPYLIAVQPNAQSPLVNAALQAMALSEGNAAAMASTLKRSPHFLDPDALARDLSAHSESAFRRLAALVHVHRRAFETALGVWLAEGAHEEAITCAVKQAHSPQLCEGLLLYFAGESNPLASPQPRNEEAFAKLLGAVTAETASNKTAPLLRADQVMRVGYRAGMHAAVVEFVAGAWADITSRVEALEQQSSKK